MVECDKTPFMTLGDWILHNLKIYHSPDYVFEERFATALAVMGDGGWDLIMNHKIDGKELARVLMDECITHPFSRDEDVWTEMMLCVSNKLEPVIDELYPHLKVIEEKLNDKIKELVGEEHGV